MRPVRSIARALTLALALTVLAGVLPARPAAAAGSEGQVTWAVHIHEKVMFGPVIEPAFLNGVGPRLEVHGLGLVANHAYSAPYEDLRLKTK